MLVTMTKTLRTTVCWVRAVTTKNSSISIPQSVRGHTEDTKLDAFFLVALLSAVCSHRAGKVRRNPINKVNNSPLPTPAIHNATWTKGELWLLCRGMYPWAQTSAIKIFKYTQMSSCPWKVSLFWEWQRRRNLKYKRKIIKKRNTNQFNNERGELCHGIKGKSKPEWWWGALDCHSRTPPVSAGDCSTFEPLIVNKMFYTRDDNLGVTVQYSNLYKTWIKYVTKVRI
jgi:hypothetical protein